MLPKNNPKVKDSNGLGFLHVNALVKIYGYLWIVVSAAGYLWIVVSATGYLWIVVLCNWLPLNSCPLQLATSE